MLANAVRVIICAILLVYGASSTDLNNIAPGKTNSKLLNGKKIDKRQGYPEMGAQNYGGTYGSFGPTSALIPGEIGFLDVDGFEGIIEPGKSGGGLSALVKSVVKAQQKRIEDMKKMAKQTRTMIQEQMKFLKKKPVVVAAVPVFAGTIATPYVPPPQIPYNPMPIPFNPPPPPPPSYGHPIGPMPPVYGQQYPPTGYNQGPQTPSGSNSY